MSGSDLHVSTLCGWRRLRAVVGVLGVAMSLVACVTQTPSQQSGASESVPYYVGVADLALYPEPRSGNAVAALALHEKVLRTRLQSGWAYVTVERTGQLGWVDNAKLIWRLPPAAVPSSEAAGDAATDTRQPVEDPQPAATEAGAAPASVLDSY